MQLPRPYACEKKDPQLEGIFTLLGRNECFGFAERTRHVRLPTMSLCGMMIYDVNDVAVRHGINNGYRLLLLVSSPPPSYCCLPLPLPSAQAAAAKHIQLVLPAALMPALQLTAVLVSPVSVC